MPYQSQQLLSSVTWMIIKKHSFWSSYSRITLPLRRVQVQVRTITLPKSPSQKMKHITKKIKILRSVRMQTNPFWSQLTRTKRTSVHPSWILIWIKVSKLPHQRSKTRKLPTITRLSQMLNQHRFRNTDKMGRWRIWIKAVIKLKI